MTAQGGTPARPSVRSTPTRPSTEPIEKLRRYRAARRVGLVAIGLIVLLGIGNLLGPRASTAAVSDEGVELAVTYARVTRSGLATPWSVQVRSSAGFSRPITLTTSARYFERFDFNQWYPEPASTTMRGDLLVLTFEPPEGDVLRVDFDGRASPTFGLGSATTTALETQGMPPLSVEYRTVVMP